MTVPSICPFPLTIDEISADWLSQVFSTTVDFEAVPMTDEAGFMSEMCFLNLISDDPRVPARCVVKLNPLFEGAREIAEKYGVIKREASFYKEAAERTPVRTPKVYFADHFETAGIMLLEDCSQFGKKSIFEPAPMTTEEALQVADSAARLHARWWNEPADTFPWALKPGDEQWNLFMGDCASLWKVFNDSEIHDLLDEPARELTRQLETKFLDLAVSTYPTDRLTLAHLDFHLDNMLFDEGAEDPVVIIDWSGAHWGRGTYDLSYFMSYSFSSEARHAIEAPFLDHYFKILVANGVGDYSREELQADYARGMTFALWVVPLGVGALDLSSDYGQRLIEKLVVGKIQAAIDHGAFEILESL